VLVLTKPLGTGVLAFAQQIGRGHVGGSAASAESMATLNHAASLVMRDCKASACIDITGFGLFGHLIRLLRQHRLSARIFADALPAFEGVLELLHDEVIPGAGERNREFVGADLEVDPGVDAARLHLGFDAQTSGGLLVAIAPERLGRFQAQLVTRGVSGVVVGRVTGAGSGRILLETGAEAVTAFEQKLDSPDAIQGIVNVRTEDTVASEAHEPGCCADVFGSDAPRSSSAESKRAFGALMRSSQAAGALDARSKELVLFGLVLHSRCLPCFEAHYARAREMGIQQEELDEVAWCAIAMGGAPVKVFYEECLRLATGG
jgi:AhpD family alkylhydroperoxidase